MQKVGELALCKFFDLDRGQVFQIFCITLGDAIYRVGWKGNVLQHQNLFSCISSSPQFLPSLSQPSLPPLTLHSQSFPHFWSIFYALLHYSQLPFTVHYLLPSFTNTLCTSLPFLQSLSFPPSLSSSALWHFPLLLPFTPFIISLSLLRSRHLMLSGSFPSSLPFSIHSIRTAVILPCNWLFKHLMLPFVSALLQQMSANVINNTGGQSVQTFICPFWAHTWMHRQPADWSDDVINLYITSCNTKSNRWTSSVWKSHPVAFKSDNFLCCLQPVLCCTKDTQEFRAVFHVKGGSFWL